MRAVILLPVIFIMTACSTFSSAPTHKQKSLAAVDSSPAGRGLAFALAHCASCHAVASGSSPNVNAPTFVDVINDPDLTDQTLTPWLRNSHNFPEIMNFEIAAENIEDLAAHMLTLKDPKYKPRI
ncbi:MAG TPA: hypothetical protein VFG34_08665 [Sphingopyxis sp.]|nr:hypothetical protein [Sphingopyxis sp.]